MLPLFCTDKSDTRNVYCIFKTSGGSRSKNKPIDERVRDVSCKTSSSSFRIVRGNCFVDGLFYRPSAMARKPPRPPIPGRYTGRRRRQSRTRIISPDKSVGVGRVENRFNRRRRRIIFYSVDCAPYVRFNLVFKCNYKLFLRRITRFVEYHCLARVSRCASIKRLYDK